MKKNKKADSVKKSTTPAPKQAKPKLRVTDESTIVMTIVEQGAFKRYGFDEKKSKEDRRILRKLGHDFRPPCEYQEVKTQLTIPSTAVKYAVSEEARPAKMGQSFWKSKSTYEKIEMFLAPIANGRKFTWELLN